MFLAEAEKASQFDKDKCKEGLLLPLPSKSLAGRKDREVLSHKLWEELKKAFLILGSALFIQQVLPECGLQAKSVFSALIPL